MSIEKNTVSSLVGIILNFVGFFCFVFFLLFLFSRIQEFLANDPDLYLH